VVSTRLLSTPNAVSTLQPRPQLPRQANLAFLRAADFLQVGLYSSPELRLSRITGFVEERGLLRRFRDGFGALSFNEVVCNC